MPFCTKDAGASDLNGGTNATDDAWETFDFSVQQLGPGDTLQFGAGSYETDLSLFISSNLYTNIASGTVGNPVTITNIPSETVTFTPPAGYNVFHLPINRSYITIAAYARGEIQIDGSGGNYCIHMGDGSSHHILKNLNCYDAPHSIIQTGTTANALIQDCDLHGSTIDYGIYNPWSSSTLEGCNIYGNARFGVHLWNNGGSNTIRNNRVYGNGSDGIIVGADSGTYNSSNNKVYQNLVYGNAANGITIRCFDDNVVANNSVYDNGVYGISVGNNRQPDNTLVKNNLSVGNGTKDIFIYAGSTNTVITYNYTGVAVVDNGTSSTKNNNATGLVALTEWADPDNATPASVDLHLDTGVVVSVGSADTADLSFITTDFDGVVRGATWDRGAYQFASLAPPTAPVINTTSPYAATVGVYTNYPTLSILDEDEALDSVELDSTNEDVSIAFDDTAAGVTWSLS